MTEPPGSVQVIALLGRLAVRRWFNRITSGVKKKQDPAVEAPRTGTARKGRSGIGLTLLGLMFISYGFFFSYQFLNQMEIGLEENVDDPRILVRNETYEEMQRLTKTPAPDQEKGLSSMLYYDSGLEHLPQAERTVEAQRLARIFSEKGVTAFRPRSEPVFSATSWYAADRRAAGLRVVGVFVFLLAFSQIWLGLGTGNQDLGKVEWTLEWLFTHPAPAGRLFFAKVIEGTLVNPLGWFLMMPFLCMMFWTAGAGAWGLLLGPAAMLFISLMLASVKLVLETWLRMVLSLDRLKNLQALCTLLGTLLWLAVLGVALARPTPAFFLRFAPRVPMAAFWNPLSLPVLLLTEGRSLWISAGAMTAFAVLVPAAAVALCRHFVRDGLLATSGTFQGSRRRDVPQEAPGRRPFFHGILAKDLRLLLRDRNFLVTTLVIPVLLFGFQAVLNPGMIRGVTGDFRHAATLAYGLGAYILMSSAFHILTVEGGSLWLLYTFPRELHSILIQKTLLWAAVALIYAGVILGVTAALNPALDLEAVSLALTAAVGVVLSAFIAGAIGALAADPLQAEPQRKIRAEFVYLYMLISSMYGYAIYGPSAWARLVQIILTALLVLALWQKVRDKLPYLLDPTELPPPTLSLSDGLVATLCFFLVQGMVMVAAVKLEMPLGPAILMAYVMAGAVVTLFSLTIFWRHKIPKLLETVGFRSPGSSFVRSLGLGVLGGIGAAAIGLSYLKLVLAVEPLRRMMMETVNSGLGGALRWVSVLAIAAAPVFEEYLFRGLVFRGLRRTMSAPMAVLASAAIFAIVHPPHSFVPVFALGVATALVFERSRTLLAPVLTHAIYNAAVLLIPR